MKLGIHAPKQGATEAFKSVVRAGLDDLIVWTISERPEDAEQFPDAFHIFRVPTPWPGEDEQAWVNRISSQVTPWWTAFAAHGGFVWQIGNEPEVKTGVGDVPNPWTIDDWKHWHETYALAFAMQWPGNGLLCAPFSVGNSNQLDEAYVAPYQGIAVHCYWWADKDEMFDAAAGLSYTHAHQLGKPIYVTECNSRPTTPEQLARWAFNAALVPAIDGVAFYIADCPSNDPDFPYDITSFDATIVRERFDELQRPSPPPAPPSPSPSGFSAASSPLLAPSGAKQAWVSAILAHGVMNAYEIVDAYWRNAPVIRYSPDLALAQACDECAWFTHQRWTQAHNPAGIGITGDSVVGFNFGSVERGVQSHLALLNCYFGDGTDPWNALEGTGYGHFTEGFTTLHQMDGVWAYPGETYAETIVEIANEVVGGETPEPAPDPGVTPVQHYQIVTPVDCPVAQGSDGGYSHGGASPGFYAIDYGCARGTPCRAVDHGMVGVIYTGDANPISNRTGPSIWIDHDSGYSTFSCHMSRIDVQTGQVVNQGDIIGLTGDPAIDGGFGSGAHLHWEIWDTVRHVRVRMEDLEAAGIAGPWSEETQPEVDMRVDGTPDDGKLKRQWHGPNISASTGKVKAGAIPLNPTSGSYQTWRAEFMAGRPLGFATSKEEFDPSSHGRRFVQYFSNGSIEGTKSDEGTWSFAVNS